MSTEIVEVRQHHIDQGAKRQGSSCPIARACHDAGIKGVHVNACSIYMQSSKDDGIKKPFNNDTFVANWVDTFDNDGEVKPFKFQIDYERFKVTSIA